MGAFYFILIVMILSSTFSSARIIEWERAGIPWNDIELNKSISIWPEQKSTQSIDKKIWKSLETTQKFFDNNPIKVLKLGSNFLPYLGKVIDILSTIENLFVEETKWSNMFIKYLKEAQRLITANDVGHNEDVLKSIKDDINYIAKKIKDGGDLLPERLQDEIRNKAGTIRSNLDIMINSYDKPYSSFRSHPLIGAPFLIEMGLVIAAIEPILMNLLDQETESKLSCKMRDVMFDYLPVMVASRLEKVHTKLLPMMNVRIIPYNSNGYENTENLRCLKYRINCTEFFSTSKERVAINDCLIDDLSTFRRLTKNEDVNSCDDSYARHIRTLVEKMLPIGLLNKTCGEERKKPSGYGWATIKLKEIYVERELYAVKYCDYAKLVWFNVEVTQCDSYIVIKIGNDPEIRTETIDNTNSYNVSKTIQTGRIQKNSTVISIKVYDADSNVQDPQNDALLIEKSGTVDYFMGVNNSYVCSTFEQDPVKVVRYNNNCLEVDIIWLDEKEQNLDWYNDLAEEN